MVQSEKMDVIDGDDSLDIFQVISVYSSREMFDYSINLPNINIVQCRGRNRSSSLNNEEISHVLFQEKQFNLNIILFCCCI